MKKLLYIVFMFVGMGLVVSCSDDDNVSDSRDGGSGQNEYTIYLDKDILDVKHVGESYEVKIRSNGDWTAEVVDAERNGWLTITGGAGNKDVEGLFTVSLDANTTDDIRTATIKVKAGTATTNLSVVQRATDGKWMLFDRAFAGQYYADYSGEGALVTFKLTGGDIDVAGNITGEAYMMTLNCYVPFSDDPNRGEISGTSIYEYAAAGTDPYTLVSSSAYTESFIDIYDAPGSKTRFVLSEESTMKSVCYDNNYRLSGHFVNEEGNTVDWYFNGIMELANTLNTMEDEDGNIVIGESGLLTLEYFGDIDDTGTGRLYMDVRDLNANEGLRLYFYITLPHDNDDAYTGMMDLGTYSVVAGGAAKTVSPGVANSSTATAIPSFSYYSDGTVNLDKLVSGGTMTIGNYDKYTDEYDIMFNFQGTDSGGAESQLTKYRYIGKLPITNNKVTDITFSPSYVRFYYDGAVTGLDNTARYRFILATDENRYARLTRRVVADFYGPMPEDPTAPNITLPVGTYTKTDDNDTAVSGEFLNSYNSLWNPLGSYYWTVSADGQSAPAAITRGSFTISIVERIHPVTGAVYSTDTTIDLNLTTLDQLRGGSVAKIGFSRTESNRFCNE